MGPSAAAAPASNKQQAAPKLASKQQAASKLASKQQAAPKLKATAKQATKGFLSKQLAAPKLKAKKGVGAKPGARERITEDTVEGKIVEWRGKIGWIKLTESVDDVDSDKDLYCAKEDLVEGTSTKKGTIVTCHVYKDAKGFGAEEVSEA